MSAADERVREVTEELRAGIEAQLAGRGGIGAPDPTGGMLEAMRELQQLHVRLVMERMGFEEQEVADACESVHAQVAGDDCIAVTYTVPPAVETYFAAVRRGDFEGAQRVLEREEG